MEKTEMPHAEDNDADDQLLSEQGIDKERASALRSLRTVNNKLANMGQSSIEAIKEDQVRFIKYFVDTKDFKP
jgi:hypothetical protein